MQEKVLFARVGYMNLYRGSANEKPMGGGSYTEENIGLEACNFLNIGKNVYGYFQPAGYKPDGIFNGTINLRRIDPKIKKDEEELDNVLVIFFATNKELSTTNKGITNRSVIIGWYKNATVYRHKQTLMKKRGGADKELDSYFLKAHEENMYLLPKEQRVYRLGHASNQGKKGNPGRSNGFFIYDEKYALKADKWISKAIFFVNNYSGSYLQSEKDFDAAKAEIELAGIGFQQNQKIKKAIEKHSTEMTIKELEKQGFKVKEYEDGQKICAKESYDLEASRNGVKYLVEVKGTQLDGSSVIFTYNEAELYKKKENKIILSIVHSIKIKGDNVVKGSGEISIKNPFKIDEGKLTAISYIYKLEDLK